MAVKGAPTGRKVAGSRRTTRTSGKLTNAVGTSSRQTLPRRGGNPSGPHASLVSGTKKGGSL